jgi:GT2 family glycosyltransferase
VEAVREQFPGVHVHHSQVNLGVAGGRNAGATMALDRFTPDYLCFLDNDLVLTAGYVDTLAEVLENDSTIGQVQSKLRYLDRPEVLNDGGGCEITFWLGQTRPVGVGEVDRGQRDQMTDCVSCGGAMMVRANLFRQLNGFDLIFNPFGPEDIDFSLRLQQAGHRAVYVPAAMAYHAESHSFAPGGYTGGYAHTKAHHWIRFLRRHGSMFQQVAFFAVGVPVITVRLLIREGRRGNLSAITGSARGLLSSLRRSK